VRMSKNAPNKTVSFTFNSYVREARRLDLQLIRAASDRIGCRRRTSVLTPMRVIRVRSVRWAIELVEPLHCSVAAAGLDPLGESLRSLRR
jgi:hypothetical protein